MFRRVRLRASQSESGEPAGRPRIAPGGSDHLHWRVLRHRDSQRGAQDKDPEISAAHGHNSDSGRDGVGGKRAAP